MGKCATVILALFLVLAGATSAMAQQPAGPPQPGPEHKKLEAFVGNWRTEGEMKPGPMGPGGNFTTTETCEWFQGGFAIVCRSEFSGAMGKGKEMSIMSYSPEDKIYTYYATNSWGESVHATGTVEGDTWTWNGESKYQGKVIKGRFTLKQLSPDSNAMKYEYSMDGSPYTLAMEAKNTRVK